MILKFEKLSIFDINFVTFTAIFFISFKLVIELVLVGQVQLDFPFDLSYELK